MHRASAVILSFRRIGNLPQILGSLLGLEWVEDIIVWHNARTLLKRWQLGGVAEASERVSIINCPENKYTWGRFLACRACENRRILIQDDDVLVMNWAEIAEAWEPESIAAGMREGHLAQDWRYHWGEAHEVLLGWGSVVDARMVDCIFKPYIEKYGHDEVLTRKADRIFSILHGHQHATLKSRFVQLPGANRDGVALYTLPDHERLTNEARRRALGLLGIEYHG